MDYSVYQSDVLQNFLNSYWNNQMEAPSNDEEATEPVDNTQEEDTEDTTDQTDWQNKYDELLNQNQDLQRQLDDFDFQKNNDLTFLNSIFDETDNQHQPKNFSEEANQYRNGASYVPTNADIAWLKTKDKTVNLSNLDQTIGSYLNSLPNQYKGSLVATSGDDSGVHVLNSKHYKGEAVDLRYNQDIYNYIAKDPNLQSLGLKVLPPNHGTAPHIHIEKKQYGGKIKKMKDGGDNKPKPKPNYGDTIAGIRSNQLNQAMLPKSQTPTSYDSKDFFGRVKKDDEIYYQALLQTAKKFGVDIPSASYTNGRSHYNPINNNIAIDTTGNAATRMENNGEDMHVLYNESFTGDVDTYLEELSHKYQFDNQPAAKQWLTNDLPHYIQQWSANLVRPKKKDPLDDAVAEAITKEKYSPYKDEKALEGQAHTIITPKIKKYFYDTVDSLQRAK